MAEVGTNDRCRDGTEDVRGGEEKDDDGWGKGEEGEEGKGVCGKFNLNHRSEISDHLRKIQPSEKKSNKVKLTKNKPIF